jgi:hypothetical protein
MGFGLDANDGEMWLEGLHKFAPNVYGKLLSLNKTLIQAFFLYSVKLSNLSILPSFLFSLHIILSLSIDYIFLSLSASTTTYKAPSIPT